MKKSIQHYSHCPRQTVTPNLNGKSTQVQVLCDFCWDEYSFCWSEQCIHEWYDLMQDESHQSGNNQQKKE